MVLSMDRWVGKVAVVTGTSSGIGAAIAESLVEKGLKVVGLARRKDRLDDFAKKVKGKKGEFFPIKADISQEEEILKAFKWIKDNVGPIHVLVNNAGTGSPTTLADGDTQCWKNTFQVNVMGLCIATREAVKDMKDNNVDGHIIHINSMLGRQVDYIPMANIYPASKFAVRALAETLRLELNAQKSKIKITNLSPGWVDTEIVPDQFRGDTLVADGKMLEPGEIADSVIYALSTPPHVQIQELTVRPIFDQ